MSLKKNIIAGCALAAACPQLADLLICIFLCALAILINACWIDNVFFEPKREQARQIERAKEAERQAQRYYEFTNSFWYRSQLEKEAERKKQSEEFRRQAEENRKKWGYR